MDKKKIFISLLVLVILCLTVYIFFAHKYEQQKIKEAKAAETTKIQKYLINTNKCYKECTKKIEKSGKTVELQIKNYNLNKKVTTSSKVLTCNEVKIDNKVISKIEDSKSCENKTLDRVIVYDDIVIIGGSYTLKIFDLDGNLIKDLTDNVVDNVYYRTTNRINDKYISNTKTNKTKLFNIQDNILSYGGTKHHVYDACVIYYKADGTSDYISDELFTKYNIKASTPMYVNLSIEYKGNKTFSPIKITNINQTVGEYIDIMKENGYTC